MELFFPLLDLDECRADPGICGPGQCENTLGSYSCRCDDGFSVRPELGPSCVDEDECLMGNYVCPLNGECVNTEVSCKNVKITCLATCYCYFLLYDYDFTALIWF